MELALYDECEDEDEDEGEERPDSPSRQPRERASLGARPPSPSRETKTRYWSIVKEQCEILDSMGLKKAAPVPLTRHCSAPSIPRKDGRLRVGSGSGPVVDSCARETQNAVAHLLSIKKAIGSDHREPWHLAYQPVGMPLKGLSLVAEGIHKNTVNCSITNSGEELRKKKTGGGAVQTTRIYRGGLASAFAAQQSSVAFALAAASYECEHVHGFRVSDPTSSTARSSPEILRGTTSPGETFVMTSTSRLLSHAIPTRITKHDFQQLMRHFAQDELVRGTIRQRVPQQSSALRSICSKITDSNDDINVWSSWILLVYLLSDPRLRSMVQSSQISDLDASVAHMMESYGRTEITRRARLEVSSASRRTNRGGGATGGKRRADRPDLEPASKRCAGGASASASASETALILAPEEDDAFVGWSSLEKIAERRREADRQLLSAKRRREDEFLLWWDAALESKWKSVLVACITQRADAAHEAAVETLRAQAPNNVGAANQLVVHVASLNAVQSARAMASLIKTGVNSVPRVLTWRARDGANRMNVHVGIVRSQECAANTTLHACRVSPPAAQPRGGTSSHTVSVRSLAVKNTTARDDDRSQGMVPGITESEIHLALITSRKLTIPNPLRLERLRDRLREVIDAGAAQGAADTWLTGTARGIVVFRARLVVPASAVASGTPVGQMMSDARTAAGRRFSCAAGSQGNEFESVAMLSETTVPVSDGIEPFATPANNVVLGMVFNEFYRDCVQKCSRSGCRHMCGQMEPGEESLPTPKEMDLPGPILKIVDVKYDFLESPAEAARLPNRRDAALVRTGLTVVVCGDSPVRMTDAIDRLCTLHNETITTRSGDTGSNDDSRSLLCVFREVDAMTFGAAARASEVNDLAASICADSVNTCIASVRRIVLGDLNLRLMNTLYQTWSVGLSSVPRRYEQTRWTGVYGPGFDIGTSGGIGTRASSTLSDFRGHGKVLMSQETVDSWAEACARNHYVPVPPPHAKNETELPTEPQPEATEYAAVPPPVRGVPHETVPDIHQYLCDFSRGMRRLRLQCEDMQLESSHPTVDCCQCMPFGPFSDRQRPYSSEKNNTTLPMRFKNPEDGVFSDGRGFQVDATCPDVSIAREPLVSNVAITCASDNIYARSQPYIATFLGAAAVLARMARSAYRMANPGVIGAAESSRPAEELRFLHKLLVCYHDPRRPLEQSTGTCTHATASKACVLLNVLYPRSCAVAESVVCEAYALGVQACSRAMEAQRAETGAVPDGRRVPPGLPLPELLAEHSRRAEMLEETRQFFSAFTRPSEISAWSALEPLLLLLLESDGSMDLSLQDLDRFAVALERAMRGVWFVHSPDGTSAPAMSSPLWGVRSQSQICAEHLNPIFVGYETIEGQRIEARGSVIGVMPMGFQQLLHLLIAAGGCSTEENVVVQYCRNEGHCIYRISAAADVLTEKGKRRSPKALSCVGVEGDEAAFGTYEEKLKLCKLQRAAFKANLGYVRPLCLAVSQPLSEAERARGCKLGVDYIKEQVRELNAQGMKLRQQEDAAQLFEQAAQNAM